MAIGQTRRILECPDCIQDKQAVVRQGQFFYMLGSEMFFVRKPFFESQVGQIKEAAVLATFLLYQLTLWATFLKDEQCT